jgi:hypothetical protein
MNWIKQNKKLAAILGVMIAGGIGLGVWLYMTWSDFSAQQEEWVALDQKAAKLENSKFTPNAENVKKLGQNLDEYRSKFELLQQVLLSSKLQREIKPISETDFQARLKERTRAVVQKAGKITELPKDFALGFDEYTASLPPSAEVAAELNVQLDVTEKLVNTLLDAGVKSLDSLERTRLPTERGGVGKTPAPPPPPPRPVNRNQRNVPVAPTVAAVVDRYPIKCVFTCDSGPLQNVMNSLANPSVTPDFLAVRQLHVENEKKEAPTKDEVRQIIQTPGLQAPPSTGEKKVSTEEIPPALPQKRDAAVILGGESIKVYVEVDYLRFRQPKADEAAAPAPAPKR